MGRRRLDFEKVDLQDSIDLAGEMLRETIHDKGEAAKKGWKKQWMFSEGQDRSKASSKEIGVLS